MGKEQCLEGGDLFKTVNLDTKGDTGKKHESSWEKVRLKNMQKLQECRTEGVNKSNKVKRDWLCKHRKT